MLDDTALTFVTAEIAASATPTQTANGKADLPGISLASVRRLAAYHNCRIREVERQALLNAVVPERYRRNLGTIGLSGQSTLLDSCVAVVGAGGLGGYVIEGLARMGIGRLILIDGDQYAENNLNRQLGCTEAVLGQFKAHVMNRRVSEVNSAVEVVVHTDWLDEENATALVQGALVLVDALDSLPTRLLLQRIAERMSVPLVHGAIAGYTGQVMTILPGEIGLVGLYGDNPKVEKGIEIQLGNPAATPMLIAAWQVSEVVKLLTGGTVLNQRLLVFDTEFGDSSEVAFS
ncbi:MAG: HesA/MoeB/ThiF family protein [Anaerolineae bacterium]